MARIKRSLDPENCVMSLGDHLEELRARLILALLGLALGAVVSLIFGKQILRAIEWPYNTTILKRLQQQEGPRMEAETLALVDAIFSTLQNRLASDPNVAADLDPKRVVFLHAVATEAIKSWVRQKQKVAGDEPLPLGQRLQVLGVAEAFLAYMKISLISGLILTAPWVFYQIWMFIAAGLYPKERQYVYKAVPFSAALFVIGALLFLFVIARATLAFFLGFGDVVGVASQWTLQKYISFITLMMLVFGLAFQTPIAVLILVRTGVVAIPTLRRHRKYVILGMAVVAAVATPSPDPLSMLALLVPLYGLYELGILLSVFAVRKAKNQETQAAQT